MKTNEFIVSKTQQTLDLNLVPYDLWATEVHVLMLEKQKLIPKDKAKKIIQALVEIEKEIILDKFAINPSLGLHLTIEAKVVEKIDTDGYYLHTARSRNDQVMTCELLYVREKILKLFSKLLKLLKILLMLSEKHLWTVMPGYTHMQPAKPTTFGCWCLSYFDMFSKCIDTLKYYYEKFDLCPLGAIESYGTSWKIDREYTAKLLGFKSVWEIPQEAISSRGFAQLGYFSALKDISIVLSKIATDLLLFNTFEFGYIELSEKTAKQMDSVTGSSVMPQKKNPDILELLRSLAPQIMGLESIVANLLSGLPMGYNRDTREVKEYIELGLNKVETGLISLQDILSTMLVKKERMLKSVIKNYCLSTDLADYISQKTGLPYRLVYQLVGQIVKNKIKKELSIISVTDEEIKRQAKQLGLNITLTKEELKMIFDSLGVIAKRNHIGGVSPSNMKKMIEKRGKELTANFAWIRMKWKIIELAKRETEREINKIIEKLTK